MGMDNTPYNLSTYQRQNEDALMRKVLFTMKMIAFVATNVHHLPLSSSSSTLISKKKKKTAREREWKMKLGLRTIS